MTNLFILFATILVTNTNALILENVRLQNFRSDLCLENSQDILTLEVCSETNPNQKFSFSPDNNQLLNPFTKKCVSMTQTGRLSQQITLQNCQPSENSQKWNFLEQSQDLYKISAVKPPQVWDVCIDSQGSDGRGGLVNWVCDQYSDQKYKVIKTEEVYDTTIANKGPVKVFIMAEFRSGSTFCSELFNQHSSGFFLFEPFIMIANSTANADGEGFLNQTKIDKMLEEFFIDCKIPDPSDYNRLHKVYIF